MTNTLALARLMQLTSAASPVGAFAYSYGIETAVHTRELHDVESVQAWIEGIFRHSVLTLDAPLFLSMFDAWENDDADEALRLSQWLIACRETAELRAADRQQGRALARIAPAVGADALKAYDRDKRMTYACAFSHVTVALGLPAAESTTAFLYTWLEGMTLAAVKLVPLGQTEAQAMLFRLTETLGAIGSPCVDEQGVAEQGVAEQGIDALRLPLDDIVSGLPGYALTSAEHETQTTRLYLS